MRRDYHEAKFVILLSKLTHRERVDLLHKLWEDHDRLERKILLLERTFTDAELADLGAGAAP